MNEELILKINEAIEQFLKNKNIKLNLLISPNPEYKIFGICGLKNTIEPLQQELINYICEINSRIKYSGVIFESQFDNNKKEIMYFFNID